MSTEETKTPESIKKIADGAMLPLDEKRVVTFIDRKFTYTFYLSRIMPDDWARYFDGIVHSSRNAGKAMEETLDLETPGIALVESKLETTDGYRGDFMATPGWQSKIPPRHTRPISWLLRTVAVSDCATEDRPYDPDSIEVLLDAAWGMNKPGEMTMYQGLVHRFKPLTAEHKRKFYRAASMTRVVGGSRNGTTIYPVRYRALVQIYDDLIQGVEGYSVNGAPLESVEAVRREMDLYHKVKAAEELFAGTNEEAGADEQK